MLFAKGLFGLLAIAGLARATPLADTSSLAARAAAGDRLVFCHFMVRDNRLSLN